MKKTDLVRRVIVISPTPTHPQNAGNRQRVHRFLTELQACGYEIHFVYTGMECNAKHVQGSPDYAAMAQSWDYFYYLPSVEAKILSLVTPFLLLLSTIAAKIKNRPALKLYYYIYRQFTKILPFFSNQWTIKYWDWYLSCCTKLFQIFAKDSQKYKQFRQRLARVKQIIKDRQDYVFPGWFPIDAWYNPGLNTALTQLNHQFTYQSALVEYVFISAALDNFSDKTLKVIDTHDVFTDRVETYTRSGIEENFFTTSADEERKGLNRANRVIAIQELEEEKLKQLAENLETYTVGHVVEQTRPVLNNHNHHNIMYLGSANASNIDGMNWFLKEVFPLVKKAVPQATITVAGLICDSIPDIDGCIKLGEIEQQQIPEFYQQSDIAINPGRVGTGLKIKNIEALGYCTPLITTSHGADGLDEFTHCFIIADQAEDFAEAIIRLMSDAEHYNSFVKNVYAQVGTYNTKTRLKIKQIFEAQEAGAQ